MEEESSKERSEMKKEEENFRGMFCLGCKGENGGRQMHVWTLFFAALKFNGLHSRCMCMQCFYSSFSQTFLFL